MSTELIELIATSEEIASAIIEGGDKHAPIMIALNYDRSPTAILIDLKSEEDKINLNSTITEQLRNLRAYAYVFITETWVLKVPHGSITEKRVISGEAKISDLPPDDKGEAITIYGIENNKSAMSVVSEIYYDKFGRHLSVWKNVIFYTDILPLKW